MNKKKNNKPSDCLIGRNSPALLDYIKTEKNNYLSDQILGRNALRQELTDYCNNETSKIDSTKPGPITSFFYQTTPFLCFLSGLGLFKYISQQTGDNLYGTVLSITGGLAIYTGTAFLASNFIGQHQKNEIRKEIFGEIKQLEILQQITEE